MTFHRREKSSTTRKGGELRPVHAKGRGKKKRGEERFCNPARPGEKKRRQDLMSKRATGQVASDGGEKSGSLN